MCVPLHNDQELDVAIHVWKAKRDSALVDEQQARLVAIRASLESVEPRLHLRGLLRLWEECADPTAAIPQGTLRAVEVVAGRSPHLKVQAAAAGCIWCLGERDAASKVRAKLREFWSTCW